MIDSATGANNNNWTEILTAEALAFGFINRVFYEKPAGVFINTLVSEDLFAQWPLDGGDEATIMGLAILQDFAAGWREDGLKEVTKDYQQLFIGPDRLPAPPWESVYLSVERLVFEQQTMEVRQFYARYGLQAANLYKEPDDHFGLEAAFMAHLCTLGLEALGRGDLEALQSFIDAQRDFLQEHLLLWAPEFLGKVINSAHTAYYRGAAHLALGTLSEAAQRRGLEIELAPDSD